MRANSTESTNIHDLLGKQFQIRDKIIENMCKKVLLLYVLESPLNLL